MDQATIPTKRAHVQPQDIQVGKPIPYDIEDVYGHLLLSRGIKLESEEQRQRLLHIGRTPYNVAVRRPQSGGVTKRRNDPAAQFLNPFDELYRISLALQETFRWIGRGKFLRRLDVLVSRVGNIIEYDPHASIGAAHLDEEFPYYIRHPIRKALLSDTVAGQLEFPGQERRSIATAALTANLGMLEYQEELDRQNAPLDGEQWEIVRNHPRRSVQRLLAEGVEDPSTTSDLMGVAIQRGCAVGISVEVLGC